MSIKRFCDNPECGKEMVADKLIIPAGYLLEQHSVVVRLELVDPRGFMSGKRAGDFCRDCLVKAVNRVEGA